MISNEIHQINRLVSSSTRDVNGAPLKNRDVHEALNYLTDSYYRVRVLTHAEGQWAS